MSPAAADGGLHTRLEVRYADFDLRVELDLPGQGITALYGVSGSGKSTTLRAMAGLEPAARGRVALGESVWQDSDQGVFLPTHQRPLGMVFQDARLFDHLSVRANLEFGWRRIPAAERRIHLDDVVPLLAIEPLLGRKPATLSGGERQRVAMARALLTSPRLLLLDEPLAALDEARKAEVLPYLERLKRELTLPMVYVSHAMHEIARLADHLVVLERGRVLAAGPVGEVTSRLDLPMSRQPEASVVVQATVAEHAAVPTARRASSAAPARSGWRPCRWRSGRACVSSWRPGTSGLALQPPQATSIQNVFPARILARLDDGQGRSHFQLDASGLRLLARITQRSADVLGLQVGQEVYAQVKGVAVLR